MSPWGEIGDKNVRIVHNASDDVGVETCYNFSFPPDRPPLCPFRYAARMLREGAAGDHFIVPRTPFRMATLAMP